MRRLLLLVLVACTRKAPEPPRADVPRAPDASVAPAAAVPIADAGPIVAWTDLGAIEGLAKSCAFDPTDAGAPTRDGMWERPSPLACRQPFEQACIADPCFHEDEESCKGQCQDTCATCGDGCVKSCESCKAGCKDDSCRRACAEACGKCRQACLTTRDHCTSADCAEVYKTCRTKLVGNWLSNGCDRVCSTCTQQCPNGDCPCWQTPKAKACKANPMLCPEMLWAEERKKLDPKWAANHCDDVCAKIWKCANAECAKHDCGEPLRMFDRCAARMPESGPCRIRPEVGSLICPEPRSD
jgi:hypothetical protein